MKNFSKRLLTAVLLVSMFSSGLSAQSNLSLYHMESIPQRIYANPANRPDAKWYMGIPAASSFDFNFSSNGIHLDRIDEALEPIPGTDSFKLNVNKLNAIFNKDIFFNTSSSVEWINFGFNQGKGYWSLSLTEKVKTRTQLPGELFELILNGNGGDNLGRTFELNAGIDLMHTRELALGYQRYFMDDRFNVGARFKYIYGLTRFETEKNDMSFYTDPDDFSLKMSADLKFNVSSAIFELDSGKSPDPLYALYGANNQGWGVDLGLNFNLNDRLSLSASILDLGEIHWNENTKVLQSKHPNTFVEFNGIDISTMFHDSADFEEAFQDLADSLIEQFDLDTSSAKFTTGLMGEFYMGAKFKLNKGNNVAALIYGSVYQQQLYPAFTLSYNMRFKKLLGLSASYTVRKGSYVNGGLGISLNAKSFQWYFVSDNIIATATSQYNSISFRTGFNLTFGRRSLEGQKKYQQKGTNTI